MSNHLKFSKKLMVIRLLVEGNSIRSIERATGVNRNTIMSLLVRVGEYCQQLLDDLIQNVDSDSIQVDEIWTFLVKKQRRVTDVDRALRLDYGDQYVFVSLDADTKLAINHLVGKRTKESAVAFIHDLGSRLQDDCRAHITSDGFEPYVDAVESEFGDDVDYAMLIKDYASEAAGRGRYSPPKVSGTTKIPVKGEPREGDIGTSYVERQNLTMRMSMRRFTRLTNGFSKKHRNLKAAVALHFAYYNFVRVHQSLQVTPAMAAGITDHIWGIENLLAEEAPIKMAA
ncbi:MAG: IS1 family transposase [Candidatus Aminicenantes bacterium]|nr:IS1 family transposase [Candidatus Aminicenantes bacterium]